MPKDYANIVTQLQTIRKRLKEIDQEVKQLQKKAIESKDAGLLAKIKKSISDS